MIRRLFLCLALTMLATLSSTPARGAVGTVTTFATVDAVETYFVFDSPRVIGIKVTGILAGGSTPSVLQFPLTNSSFLRDLDISVVDPVARCDRMAMLAMSKPGKFQLAFVETNFGLLFNCRLLVRTP